MIIIDKILLISKTFLVNMNKIIRTATVPQSLNSLLKGQLSFLSQYYSIIAVSGYNDKLEEVRNRENVAIRPIEMQRHISIYNDLIALYKLFRLFKKEKPLIVHSITPKAGLLSMLAAKMAKVPIRMHTFTGLVFPTKTGWLQKILIIMDKLLCWCATNVYPEGNGVKADLIRFNITSKPLKIIANGNINGIDVDYFSSNNISEERKKSLKAELKILPNDYVFIFVGRLVGDKGINELVKVFSNLSSKNGYVKLLLVGPYEKDFDPLSDETMQEINNNPDIISVGYQDDVRPYLAISDAFVFPSYREGFPNVVMQAGAMGLPCIVTNISGCNEIIIEGENGIIIPPKDKKSLMNAMQFFLSNQHEVKRMAANARQLIVTRYEQKTVWEALLAEYKRLEEELEK